MSKLDKQFLEDRSLRNDALRALKADVTHLKTGLSGKGLAERTVSRIGTGAKDVLGEASETAGDNRGVLAALIGAVILWFARQPLLEALGLEELLGDEVSANTVDLSEDEPSDVIQDGADIELIAPETALHQGNAASGEISGDEHE